MKRVSDKPQAEPQPMDLAHALPSPAASDLDLREENKSEHREKPSAAAAVEEADASRAEIQRLKKERDALFDRLARAQAEFENARKRMTQDQQEFKEFALADALQSLLPVLDSFDWALQTPSTGLEEFRNGIDLIRKQLHDALAKLGLQPVPARGERFDPHLHEAVEVADAADSRDGRVARELRPGYKLGDRLLRPAMVVVARKQ